MSEWVTLTSVEGGVCRLDRAQIAAYREGMFYDARDWAKKDSAPCRVVVAGGINICVTETMDELRDLIEVTNARESPYGYCPICGAPGEIRERRPNGNDQCANWHQYPSRDALPEPPKDGEKSWSHGSNTSCSGWCSPRH